MGECLVVEVVCDELDDGVLAVLGFDDRQGSVRLVANGNYSQLGSSSPWASRVRRRCTIKRWSPTRVSAIWAMLIGG